MNPVRNCATCGVMTGERCTGCNNRSGWPNWTPWTPKVRQEPSEVRIDVVGQNGNTGEHYDLVGTVEKVRAIVMEADPDNTAGAMLERAASIMAERGRQYDSADGERSMGRAVQAFNAITGRDMTEPEGWLLLQVLKDVRQWQKPGYHADSAEDCIAYAALKAEALARA